MMLYVHRSGQSLIEVLVAIAIGAILFIGAAVLIAPTLQITKATSQAQTAAALGDELINNVRVFSEGNWQNIFTLSTSSATHYYLITSSSPYTATSGVQTISLSSTTYTRYFSLSSMYRDSSGNATTSASGTSYDPSLEAVNVTYNWTRGVTTTITEYLTRNRNTVSVWSDWSGGPGFTGPATTTNNQFSSSTNMNYSTPGSLTPAITGPYTYYQTITITSSTAIASGTNSYFDLLVSSTVPSWAYSAYGGKIQNLCQSGSNQVQEPCDLMFSPSSTCSSTLNAETESYSSSTGSLVDWVSVPTLSAGTVIYVCYDNVFVTTPDLGNVASIWTNYNNNNGDFAVYHFPSQGLNGEDSAYGTQLNETNITGTSSSKIDGGISLTGNSYAINGNTFNASYTAVSAWVNLNAYPTGTSLVAGFVQGNGESNYDKDIFINSSGSAYFTVYTSSGYVNSNSLAVSTGTWHYLVGVYDTSNNAYMYVDGVPTAPVNGGGPSYTGYAEYNGPNLLIGGMTSGNWGNYITASVDEVRFGEAPLSPSWILSEYNNQNSPSTFYSLGSATLVNPPVPGTVSSSTNDHWAWNDTLGWIDFYNSNDVGVNSSQLTGYASSSAGDISLDCATTRKGNICGSSNYQVLNDGFGNLSGWAWNDAVGWISFCGGNSTSTCPGTVPYEVTIDSGGNFQGWAWNDAVGWIDFNCDNTGGCGTSNYEVQTTWLPFNADTTTTDSLYSGIFDTGVASGAQLNSVLWQGNRIFGSPAEFQFAVSNTSTGPWTYVGSDGTSNTYFTPSNANKPLLLGYNIFTNYRYFRYRLYIQSRLSPPNSTVNDVIVNWSP